MRVIASAVNSTGERASRRIVTLSGGRQVRLVERGPDGGGPTSGGPHGPAARGI
jgi:hypothetical protein